MLALALVVLAADPLFVTATSLNVRAEPKAAGKLVYVARIAETCTPKGAADKGGWVELDCGPFHGFAKAEFLAAQKPTIEALNQRYTDLAEKDDRATWEERFVTLQRLIALGEPPEQSRIR